MDSYKAIVVIGLVVGIVVVINVLIYAGLARRQEAGQIELLRRAAKGLQQPWKAEDEALQELSQRVAAWKQAEKDEQDHAD